MPTEFFVIYAPIDQFVLLLARGWRFAGHVAQPMQGHHGHYCCLLEKDCVDE